ncbi:MAG TPA: chorismate mutase [Acidisoma sp.]|nr:chorismate mutase [Acidisoma sp.]
MSSSAEAAPGADIRSPPPADSLPVLRDELDGLDDRMLDLLIQRATVVERVAAAKRGVAPLRPGREAAILRRLLGQHQGTLPRSAIIRIWREIFASSIAQQQSMQVAVCDPAMDGRFLAAAREHLGALTPMRVYRGPAQAIGEVVDGRASVAILPLPGESTGEASGPGWWPGLLQHNASGRIHVVARLPFWANRPEGAPSVAALMVANAAADPSGHDISLLALEVEAQLSLGSLSNTITVAGFKAVSILVHRPAGVQIAQLLVEVEGFVTADDPRLAQITGLQAPPLIVGAYAIAVSEDSAV